MCEKSVNMLAILEYRILFQEKVEGQTCSLVADRDWFVTRSPFTVHTVFFCYITSSFHG